MRLLFCTRLCAAASLTTGGLVDRWLVQGLAAIVSVGAQVGAVGQGSNQLCGCAVAQASRQTSCNANGRVSARISLKLDTAEFRRVLDDVTRIAPAEI
jgi:hypothetical protein